MFIFPRAICYNHVMKKIFIAALLLMLASVFLAGCGKTTEGSAAPGPDPKPVSEEETITLSVEQVKSYAETSATIWEFVQDLLPNYIVYRSTGGKFAYAPVDRSLPQSGYDWSKLVEVGSSHREVEYRQEGKTLSMKGIDVSTYQGQIDWQKVAGDGVKFAFVRLGYRGYETGRLVTDDRFEENVTGAITNNIGAGVYFVTQAISVEEAVEEANFVLENIKAYNITWPIVIDIEDAASETARTAGLTQQERTDFAVAFCETIKAAGYRPMIYCNIRWFIEKLDITRIADYDKWFAQYFRKPFFPYSFQIWQYSSSGRVDGINGDVDLNICFMNYSDPEPVNSVQ